MKSVVVIGTIHTEAGLATANKLESIVMGLDPDVLFLECPPDAFEDFMRSGEPNLEATVAAMLLARGRVHLLPVDLPTPDARFFWEQQQLCGRVEARNLQYCAFVDLGAQQTRAAGFDYLNSTEYDALWTSIDAEMRETVEMFRDPVLTASLDRWNHQLEARDKAMMARIEKAMTEGSYERGVLLVGAAHRRSLRAKASGRTDVFGSLRWEFWAGSAALESSLGSVQRGGRCN